MIRKPPMIARHPVSFGDAHAAGLTRGVCLQVIDGDTADFLLDLGWFQYSYTSLRIAGMDAAELRGRERAERALAAKARRRLAALVKDRPVLVQSRREALTFDRFVADVYAPAPPDASRGVVRRIGGLRWLDVARVLLRERLARPSER